MDRAASAKGWWVLLGLLLALVLARMLVSDWRLAASFVHYTDGQFGVYDLGVYIGAEKHWSDTGDLYGWADVNGYGFTYPPIAAVILRPVLWGSPETVAAVWRSMSLVVALVLVALVAARSAAGSSVRLKVVAVLLGASAFLGSAQFQNDLVSGQVNVFLALLIVLDVGEYLPARLRGVFVGFAAAFKLTPLVVIGWYVITRQWVVALRALAVVAIATGLGWLVAPSDSLTYWTEKVSDTSRVGDESLRFNASVFGFLGRWGVDGAVQTGLWLLVGGLLALVACWRAEQQRRDGDPVAGAVLLGVVAVLSSPISWPAHQIWLPLAGVVLLTRINVLARVTGAGLLAFSVLLVPIAPLWDRLTHAPDLLGDVNFAVFVAVAVCGLGAREPVSRSVPESQPSPRPPSDRRSPSAR